MVLPISNFCFHSGVTLHELCWLYGGRSARTVVALSLPRVIKSRACTERVEAPWRPWTLPAWALRDKSHGAKHKQGQSASTEVRRTTPDSSAYYGGAWVTCIFELKKNLDFSIVQKMFFRQPVYRLRVTIWNDHYEKNLKIVTKFNVFINLELPQAVTTLFGKWKVSLKKVLKYSH